MPHRASATDLRRDPAALIVVGKVFHSTARVCVLRPMRDALALCAFAPVV